MGWKPFCVLSEETEEGFDRAPDWHPRFRRCAGANRYAIDLVEELGVKPPDHRRGPEMASPCIKVCVLEDDVCVGRRRTMAEIVA